MTQSTQTGPPPVVGDGAELLAWLAKARRSGAAMLDEATGSVHVLRHAEALEVLAAPEVFSSDFTALLPPPEPGVPNFMEASLTVTDPPWHGQLRRLISQGFTPRATARLEPRIQAVTTELLDALGERRDFDLVRDLAYPLPVMVISELLGIPSADRDLFRHWAELLLPDNADVQVGEYADAGYTGERAQQLNAMAAYLAEHVHDRRRQPRDDLISTLVQAEVDGERLTEQQIVNFSAFLLLAGHLTTTLLLSNALLCLTETGGTLARLRADRGLMPAAIEEVLRYRPPVVFLYRLAKTDTHVGGVPVPAGRIVVVWLMSANRDERVFAGADRFELGRSANPHLTFSKGVHFCLGAPLARMESTIALNALLDRYPDIRCGEPTYQRRPDVFGVTELPILV